MTPPWNIFLWNPGWPTQRFLMWCIWKKHSGRRTWAFYKFFIRASVRAGLIFRITDYSCQCVCDYSEKRFPYFLVGWLWYTVTILPVLGIVQFGHLAISDHHTYLPSIGIAVMLAWGCSFFIFRRRNWQKDFIPGGSDRPDHSGGLDMAAMRILEKHRRTFNPCLSDNEK